MKRQTLPADGYTYKTTEDSKLRDFFKNTTKRKRYKKYLGWNLQMRRRKICLPVNRMWIT